MIAWQYAKRIDTRVAQQPDARFQRGGARLDAVLEPALCIRGKYRNTIKDGALAATARGVNDRLAVVSSLTYPGCATATARRGASRLPEQFGFEALGAFLKYRGNGIVDCSGHNAE